MDIREFIQAVAGAVILQPDQLLLRSAGPNSYVLRALTDAFSADGAIFGPFSVFHTFALVVGLGLLMGIGPSTSLFIAIFVVLGVAEGLFAVGALFGVLGLNGTAMTDSIANALGPTFSHAIVADGYVLFPFVILAVGAVRYRWGSKRLAKKAAEASHESMRHYCSYCGSVIDPGARSCAVCSKEIPKASEKYCSSCGRHVPLDAPYCWFCGEQIKWSGAAACRSCQGLVALDSKFCPNCGARQPGQGTAPSP